jgi:hypothetical protein
VSSYIDYTNTANGFDTYTISAGATGSSYAYDIGVMNTATSLTQISNTLQVNGNADISGNLKVGGKDIAESLERIEERLAILRPNEELEEKWENLRGLRKAYMELEAELIEKEKVWGILKK